MFPKLGHDVKKSLDMGAEAKMEQARGKKPLRYQSIWRMVFPCIGQVARVVAAKFGAPPSMQAVVIGDWESGIGINGEQNGNKDREIK